MVFNSVLSPKRELKFNFAWPKALVVDGKCQGAANLTLVYEPIIDGRCGAEFVRVNLDAHLRQHMKDGSYKGHAHQLFMQKSKRDSHFEADLIDHGLKWWPIKRYVMRAPKGLSGTSDWQLIAEPLVRDGTQFPSEGVPFCAILTIFDPKGDKPVFNDMRLWLSANNVKCGDIRTAARIRPRSNP